MGFYCGFLRKTMGFSLKLVLTIYIVVNYCVEFSQEKEVLI